MKHIIVIPVFNDWKSLNKLLIKLNLHLRLGKKIKTEVLVINDNSTEKMNLKFKKLNTFKSIKILSLNRNFGSQISIAIGLNYLKKRRENFFITVMDADGEDSPKEVSKMLNKAIKNKEFIITSNRKKRKESFIIIFLYKLHLLLTFLFTTKWISFGNFSTFNSKNLKTLLSNKNSFYAHSSSILQNCNIKRLYAKREKRFFDKSKLGLFALIDHSLRVNSVFSKNIFFTSIIYLMIVIIFLESYIFYFILFSILFYDLLIIIIKVKFWNYKFSKLSKYIVNIKSFRTS